MKLLSIAIPTFNRSQFIKENLEVIIPQLLCFKDITEIVISDNCSTDDTEAVVCELSRKYDYPIDYKKLDTPIYFEDNFKAAVERSSGEYVQMMGDDDIMCPSFYDFVIKILKDHSLSLLHLNWLTGDENCSNSVVFDKKLETPPVLLMSTASFIKRLMNAPGFMSSLVFSRDCWNVGAQYEKENYYGYHFLGRLYHGACHLKAECCYCSFPMLIMRSPVRSFSKTFPLFFFVGYSNIFKDLKTVIPDIEDLWLNKIHNTQQQHYLSLLAGVNKDKSFYKERRMEFWPFLSQFQKFTFNYMVSRFSNKLTRGLYYFFVRLFVKN